MSSWPLDLRPDVLRQSTALVDLVIVKVCVTCIVF